MTVMRPESRPAFEEGASLVFSLWSALSLAIDNEFGGRHSRDKAQQLWVDVVQWFYDGKGAFLAVWTLRRVAETLTCVYMSSVPYQLCLYHVCMVSHVRGSPNSIEPCCRALSR